MADAHIEIAVGELKLVATGSENWVDSKYDSFFAQIKELKESALQSNNSNQQKERSKPNFIPTGSLAIFLKERNVGPSQNNRFLATAIWLKHNGQPEPKTTDVVRALAEAQQQRLGNPSDVLNKLVRKGHCVKSGAGFYVTPEGEESLK